MKKIIKPVMIVTMVLFSMNMAGAKTFQENLAVFKSVQIQRGENTLDVTIEIEGTYSYQHFELEEPMRLVVEFSPVGEIHAAAVQEVNTAGVKSIRTGRFQTQTARVVFDLLETQPSYEITQSDKGIQVSIQAPEGVLVDPEVTEEEMPAPVITETEPTTQLTTITHEKIEDQLQVSIAVKGHFSYKTFRLEKYSQLTIDIEPVQEISATPFAAINEWGLKEIRVSRVEPETARIMVVCERWLSDFEIERVADGILIKFPLVQKTEAVKVPEKEKKVEKEKAVSETFVNTMLAFSIGSFKVSDPVFQEIYKTSVPVFGLELSRNILRAGNFRLDLAFAGRMYSATGASVTTVETTKFRNTPITFAARLFFNTKYVAPYIGGGIDIHKYKEENILGTITGSTTGSHFQAGLYLKIPQFKFAMLNLYIKLVNATATEGDISIDLGGTEIGVALTLGYDILKKGVLILAR
ncbi:MAG: AMIN domain-containing protein [Candidatus Aminicenantes bacterium]|nr:AMIN domain-containing protein [Candidatus Aminicenantes bacterium]